MAAHWIFSILGILSICRLMFRLRLRLRLRLRGIIVVRFVL